MRAPSAPVEEPCMPIKLSLSSTEPLSVAADLLILGVPEGAERKDGVLGELAKELGPSMARALKREEFTGKKDQAVELATAAKLKAHDVLLLGLGAGPLTDVDIRLLAARGARAALAKKASSIAIELPKGIAGGERAAAEGLVLGAYRFTKYLTGDRVPKVPLERATLVVHGKLTKEAKDAAT